MPGHEVVAPEEELRQCPAGMEIPYQVRSSQRVRGAARVLMRPVVARRRVPGTPFQLRFPAWRHLGMVLPGGMKSIEPELAAHMRALLAPGQTAVDAGANVGFYSLLLAHLVGSAGAVHSFEPDPRASSWLLENIRRNQLDNVTPWSVALGEDDGVVELHLDLVTTCGSSTHPRWDLDFDPFERQPMRVRSARLDSLGIDAVDFIKIDVEGAELALLTGARETIRNSRPSMLIEVIDRSHLSDAVSFLRSIDYDVADASTGAAPRPDSAYSGNLIATPRGGRQARAV